MPLVASALASGLEPLFDTSPLDAGACAAQWADALSAYAAAIVPPSTQVTSAADAFEGAVVGMDQADQAETAIRAGLTAFAGVLSAGMQPAFSGVPPVAPWEHTFSNTLSASEAAQVVADSIDAWMKTGSAMNNASGVVTTWA